MKKSVTNRIIIGKTIGLIAGISVFFALPVMGATLDPKFGVGLILFYSLLGAIIGLMGMFDRHPVLNFKMPWWLLGTAIGTVLHIILVLVSYDQIALIAEQIDIFGMTSPWWAILDGAILGLIMSFAEKKFAGEGNIPLK
jgi:hypothetical protein